MKSLSYDNNLMLFVVDLNSVVPTHPHTHTHAHGHHNFKNGSWDCWVLSGNARAGENWVSQHPVCKCSKQCPYNVCGCWGML